jgi:hypothetical protein
MKSLFRGVIERMSSSVKAHTSVAVAAVPPALGRWGIQYDEQIIARKIVQANEDHCGCCHDVTAENQKKKKKSYVSQYEKMEEYLLPYVM